VRTRNSDDHGSATPTTVTPERYLSAAPARQHSVETRRPHRASTDVHRVRLTLQEEDPSEVRPVAHDSLGGVVLVDATPVELRCHARSRRKCGMNGNDDDEQNREQEPRCKQKRDKERPPRDANHSRAAIVPRVHLVNRLHCR
jgi:hypothetical protein